MEFTNSQHFSFVFVIKVLFFMANQWVVDPCLLNLFEIFSFIKKGRNITLLGLLCYVFYFLGIIILNIIDLMIVFIANFMPCWRS